MLRVWVRGGLFQLQPPSPVSCVDKTSGLLGFSVWYLDLLLLVIFVSDSPLCLGFSRFFESLHFEGTFRPRSTFLGFLMSESTDKKPFSMLEVVLMMSKITEDKLTGPNYLD